MTHNPETTRPDADLAAALPVNLLVDPPQDETDHGSSVSRAVIINRPREEVYGFWRELANLPLFMENVRAVEAIDERRSRWTVAGPLGSEVQWDAEIIEDIPGERLAWRSLEGGDIDHEGVITFLTNPFGRGTEVRAMINYDPPAGVIGKVIAKVAQREPRIQLRRDLRRFKQLLETGEVPTSQAPDAGPRS
jgi:uncharacterized membrane protein